MSGDRSAPARGILGSARPLDLIEHQVGGPKSCAQLVAELLGRGQDPGNVCVLGDARLGAQVCKGSQRCNPAGGSCRLGLADLSRRRLEEQRETWERVLSHATPLGQAGPGNQVTGRPED